MRAAHGDGSVRASGKGKAASPVLPGDVVGGKYRVERMLGIGGMGIVVAATHLELGHPVALKFLLPNLVEGKSSTPRFFREARAVARLRSEHVARVYDVGFHAEKYPYMVLELLEGCDLARVQDKSGSLPVAEAVEYVAQALAGLADAHGAGIVHRDLKPQNVFVTRRSNGAPLVKLLDFGLAKTMGPLPEGQRSLTHVSAIMGSPLYMAPEQMRGARFAETRSDLWSIGVILYELLGGAMPFEGETVFDIALAIATQTPRSLLTLRPAIDPALDAIVMRCLEKAPERRWQSAEELAAALEAHRRPSISLVRRSSSTVRMFALPAPPPLAQTAISWGEVENVRDAPSRDAPSRDARSSTRPRHASRGGFGKGIVVGLCLSALTVAATAFVLRRPAAPAFAAAPPPPVDAPMLMSATLPVAPPRVTAIAEAPASTPIESLSAAPPPPPKKKKTPAIVVKTDEDAQRDSVTERP